MRIASNNLAFMRCQITVLATGLNVRRQQRTRTPDWTQNSYHLKSYQFQIVGSDSLPKPVKSDVR